MNKLSITSITILVLLNLICIYNKNKVEHFYIPALASIPKFIKAATSFLVNFVDLFMVLVDAILNFFLNFETQCDEQQNQFHSLILIKSQFWHLCEYN